MHQSGLTRSLAAFAAAGSLAAGLAASAQADPPGDRLSSAPATASVRPDDRADRAWPASSTRTATVSDSGTAFEAGDVLGITLVVTAVGLGIGAMVYTHRLGSA